MNRKLLTVLVTAATVLAPGPAAALKVGETFVFSDGRTERVKALKEDRVVWTTREGSEFARAYNVALPILEWRIGARQGVRRVYGAEPLWPPRPGKRANFRVVTEVQRENDPAVSRSVQLWTCAIGRMETVVLPAAPFQAMPIRCDRFAANSMRLVERRTWWWSAEVDHFVRREFRDMQDGKREIVTLCAVLPPEHANRVRVRALAQAKC